MGLTSRELARIIRREVKPGQWYAVERECMPKSTIPGFSDGDCVMENILGGAYEFSCDYDPIGGRYLFKRRQTPLPHDGSRTYVSPDRRHLFDLIGPDLWKAKAGEAGG